MTAHKRFRYKVIDTQHHSTLWIGNSGTFADQLAKALTEHGKNGWRLVTTIGGNIIIFEQEIKHRPNKRQRENRREAKLKQ